VRENTCHKYNKSALRKISFTVLFVTTFEFDLNSTQWNGLGTMVRLSSALLCVSP